MRLQIELFLMYILMLIYIPPIDSIVLFWPRLAKGGYVGVEDYGSCKFPGSSTAIDEPLKSNNVSFFIRFL